jgi:hypothetical protein
LVIGLVFGWRAAGRITKPRVHEIREFTASRILVASQPDRRPVGRNNPDPELIFHRARLAASHMQEAERQSPGFTFSRSNLGLHVAVNDNLWITSDN